ncbi:unnamed protein product, partial [Porites lobata]
GKHKRGARGSAEEEEPSTLKRANMAECQEEEAAELVEATNEAINAEGEPSNAELREMLYNEVERGLVAARKKIQEQEEELYDLQDKLEQYTSKNSIEIHGVPECAYIETEDVVLKLAEALDVSVEPKDIEICHKLNRKGNKPIIVKFISHKVKTNLYREDRESNIALCHGKLGGKHKRGARGSAEEEEPSTLKRANMAECQEEEAAELVEATNEAINAEGEPSNAELREMLYNEVERGLVAARKKIQEQEEELYDLQDKLEQYTRKNSIEIHGVPECAYIETEDVVLKLAEALDVSVEPKDIEICHKLNRKGNKPIIVKFISHKVKTNLYREDRESNIALCHGKLGGKHKRGARGSAEEEEPSTLKRANMAECQEEEAAELVEATNEAINAEGEPSNAELREMLQYNEVERGLVAARKKIQEQEEEIGELYDLQDKLEQYTRKNSIEIHGVPEYAYTETEDVVLKLAEALDVSVEPKDIEICHKLNRKGNKPIIVKFISHKVKTNLYRARAKLKNNLTSYRKKIMNRANEMRRNDELLSVWSMDGSIYVKTSPQGKPVRINELEDLDYL